MFGYNRYVVAQDERALLIRDGAVVEILDTGVHRYFDPLNRLRVERFSLQNLRFEHGLLEALIRDRRDLFDQWFTLVEIGETEIGLVYVRDALTEVLLPRTRAAFWNIEDTVRVERADVSETLEVAGQLLRQMRRSTQVQVMHARKRVVLEATVAAGEHGLLFVDGVLNRELQPGTYGFWQIDRPVSVKIVDLRRQAMEVSGQEILTKDKVSLRVNLAATYRITDPRTAVSADQDFEQSLYRELQFALRQAISAQNLDPLLGNKSTLDTQVFELARQRTEAFGVTLEAVGVKDIILPGDMKTLLNQVVEAEKAAQANVIRRREETAATRSLLNTAKLMADNPTLMRLKELEALEKVVENVGSLTVYNGLEGILSDTIKLGTTPK